MSNIKFSELPNLGTITANTTVPVVAAGTNYTITAANLQSYVNSSTGNITGGNLLTGAQVIANGEIQSGTGFSTGGYLSVDGDADLHKTNVTGNLSATGNITGNYFIGNGSQLTGIAASYGNSNVATFLAAYGSNTISTTGNITAGNTIVSGTANTGVYALDVGVTATFLSNTVSSFTSNVNNYTQLTLQNLSTGADATTDFVLTANNGSDTVNYGDFGIINSGYDNATPTNSLGNIVFAADTYLYAQGNTGNTSQSGGNLAVGTAVAGKTVKIFAGGVTNSSIVANISNTGVAVTGTVSATGNISTAGAFVGNGAALTNVTVNVAGNVIGTQSNVTLTAGSYNWTFDNTGNLTLPGNTFSVNYANGTAVSIGGGSSYGNANVATFLAAYGSNTISTTGSITSGNITGGNVLTAGALSATGNVTGNYILGNGALLTGVITSVANINSGTSNVTVTSSGGNISVGIGGTSNVAVFATTGEYVTGLISASGNVTGGNVLTGGLISSTGNITGGNISATNHTGTTVSVSGNVTGGNVLTGGLVSATATVTGGNLVTGGTASATGNITGGNVLTAGIMSSTGNATHGNILTAGVISATGNITGGNISATNHTGTTVSVTGNITAGNIINTGISSVTGNITGGNVLTGGLISATGNVTTANYFIGNLLGTTVSTTGNVSAGNVIINGQPTTYGVVNGNYAKYTRTASQSVSANSVIVCNVSESTSGSGISVNTSTGQVTLTAGKTYRLRGTAGTTVGSAAGSLLGYGWYNETTSAWIGEGAGLMSPGSTNYNTSTSGTAEVVITVASTTVVSLRVIYTNNVSSIGGNSADFGPPYANPWIDIQDLNPAIAVQATATGTINNQYASITNNTDISITNGVAKDVTFDTVTASSGIPYSTSTGVFTLTSGVTYRFTGELSFAGYTGYALYTLVDATTNTPINGQIATCPSYNSGFAEANNNTYDAIYTPSTNQTVKFRVTGSSFTGTGVIRGGYFGRINVQQINNAFALNTLETMSLTGNITTSGNVSATGNVTGGNVLTGGVISSTGNITGGNISATNHTGTTVSVTGNITAANFFGNGNTLSNVATRFESAWTVPVGNSTQSFTVAASETYYLWVDCNIPNGILAWNATATVTNTNVPVVGVQYAWVYNGGGSPIDFTSIPNQFVGTANSILRSSVAPSATTNRFDFGLNNTSGGNVTVRYGWVAIS